MKSEGAKGFETTLIIKGSTLTLKYVIRRAHFSIHIQQLSSGEVLYAILIEEYDDKPLAIWAVVETEEELSALTDLDKVGSFPLFLFNEAAVNVCWADVHCKVLQPLNTVILKPLVFASPIRTQEDSTLPEAAIGAALAAPTFLPTLQTVGQLRWHEITNHYITNQFIASPIGILTENEGNQQEELCTWLLDNLSPSGAFKDPIVQEETKQREITDVLLTYLGGCFLIESKTLAVLERDELPSRPKLRKNVLKNINKALSQLPGACRNIRAGLRVTSVSGQTISISREMPPHCIVLVPELSLLTSDDGLGGEALKQFLHQNAAYLHFLDPSELMSVMRAAGHIAYLGKTTSHMMAFDALLIRRWERAIQLDTPHFAFRLQIV